MALLIMKKFKFIHIMLLAALTVVLTSCEKKVLCLLDHPHNPYYVHTALTVKFNSAWDDEVNTYLNNPADYQVRYTFEFWSYNENGNPVEKLVRQQFIGDELLRGENTYTCNIDLPAEKMVGIVFVDLVRKGETDNNIFNVDDLTAVTLSSVGFDPQKDCFSINQDIDFSGYATNHPPVEGYQEARTLEAKRILSCYKLIANDYTKFVEERNERGENIGDPYVANIAYNLWVPMQYNAFYQYPQLATLQQAYQSQCKAPSGTYVELATDVIFTGARDESLQYYNITCNTLDAASTLISSYGNIQCEIHRNHITYIYGPYLTTTNIGATGIDDAFDDYINIVLPD